MTDNMVNLLGSIKRALDGEEIDIIVFGTDSWSDDYNQWTEDSRFNWIKFNTPYGRFDLIEEKFDILVDAGFGGADFPPFWAVTKSQKYVLICAIYDGATSIHRIPTSYQNKFRPEFYGGG